MFGQSNDKKHDDKYKVGNGPMGNPDFSNAVNELASKNDDGIHVGPAPSDPTPQGRSAQTPPPNWGHPGKPVHSQPHHNQALATPPPPPPPPPQRPEPTPPQDNQFSSVPPQSDNQPVIPPRDQDIANDSANNLAEIKQKALADLSPIVSHLDQSPEEKFHTIMMMIQASDNQDLLGAAHKAAGQIQDEKLRAQALLDVVNEVNYFAAQQDQN